MTESEAIEKLREKYMDSEYYFAENDEYEEDFDEDLHKAYEIAISALREIQQYRALGTLEELREAMEKQRAKKPKKETYEELLERLLLKYNISDYLLESVKDWLEYKIERNNFKYKEKGLNTLLRQISDTAKRNGDEAVANAIRQSIASGYQGIVWDKVSKGNQNRNGGGIDWSNV